MKLARKGREAQLQVPDSRVIGEKQLQSSELKLLNKFYLAKLPEYKAITVAYNAAMKAMPDHQNVLPSKSEWNPPGRHILPSEKQLLCGPSQTITVLQKVHF